MYRIILQGNVRIPFKLYLMALCKNAVKGINLCTSIKFYVRNTSEPITAGSTNFSYIYLTQDLWVIKDQSEKWLCQ